MKTFPALTLLLTLAASVQVQSAAPADIARAQFINDIIFEIDCDASQNQFQGEGRIVLIETFVPAASGELVFDTASSTADIQDLTLISCDAAPGSKKFSRVGIKEGIEGSVQQCLAPAKSCLVTMDQIQVFDLERTSYGLGTVSVSVAVERDEDAPADGFPVVSHLSSKMQDFSVQIRYQLFNRWSAVKATTATVVSSNPSVLIE
ncbi:hypothetical protein HDU77_000171 [Chytriomyces hyalinus]|nr:hypothetical protein HDU77_000171 [Chytriomyces hyalinus]